MTNLTFNYIGYIRRLDMRAYTSSVTIRSCITQGLSSCQLTYIQSDEFDQLYQLNPFAPTYASYLSTQDHILKRYYEIMLEQDTLWSLADPILELEFFAVPHILSINRFQQVVGRLKSLEEVRFAKSMKFDYPLESNEVVIGEMFRCVQEHLQLSKGRLKSVICLEGYEAVDKDYTTRIQLEMLRLLPPLRSPSGVPPESWEDIIDSNQSILQRCRALRRIDVHSSRKGMSKWAVQEKIDLERNVEQGALVLQDTARPEHQISGLVPLERINRRYDLNTDDIDDLDDIAFSQSLGYLTVDVPTQGYLNLLSAPKPLHLGRGWPARLERLDILSLCGWSALTFDPATLSSTSGLMSLPIQIRSWHYGNEEVESFIPPVEELNQSYSIHTEPAAMGTDAALGTIRPRWTWDWQPPFLTSLKLAFEVAYLFEFKMLHGRPSLTGLSLDIFPLTPADHTRIVSESGLLVPTTSNSIGTSSTSPSSSSSSKQLMPERLCLPNLVQITLNGAWVIDDKTMPIFLAETFPNVKQVQLNRLTTTTLESLFKLFRPMPQRYDESVSLAITRLSPLHDMARLGIDKVHDNYFRQSSIGEDFFIHFIALLKGEASGDDDEDDDEDSGDAYLGVNLELYDLLYDGNHYRILKR
ncbi:hypothetical protein BGX24_009489 [Mortierella sp. AD032]|nr:hypothetical protein BGX24_009489 [Mortierella sp. AD032]